MEFEIADSPPVPIMEFYIFFYFLNEKATLTNTEKYSLNVVETMNPLFPLRTLSSSVKHSEQKIFVTEINLGNTTGLDSRVQNILSILWYDNVSFSKYN